jgi:hypothetical protein
MTLFPEIFGADHEHLDWDTESFGQREQQVIRRVEPSGLERVEVLPLDASHIRELARGHAMLFAQRSAWACASSSMSSWLSLVSCDPPRVER